MIVARIRRYRRVYRAEKSPRAARAKQVDRIVNMIVRRVIGRLVNRAVDAGLNAVTRNRGGAGLSGAQARGARRQAKGAMRMLREIGRN